jgi:ATP-dependent DNA helicase RecG
MKSPVSELEISSWIAQGMGQGLHWFSEDVPPARLAPVLAGMANAQGGTVLLGLAPRTPEIMGLRDLPAALDRVFQAALLADPALILPIPTQVIVQGCAVLVISVPPGLPHVYSVDGRFWGREGTQTNPLSARRLRALLMERGAVQLESRLVPGVTLEDLDLQQIDSYCASLDLPPGFDWREVLLRRGCLQKSDGEYYPTHAALLLFGRAPQQWLPSASILAARFTGPAFTDNFIRQELAGTLPNQLRQAEAFLRANLRSVVRMSGLNRQETLEYPFEAVRELLVNAVAHRDYNLQGDTIHIHVFTDHLEIHSPGTLPGPVTLNNLLEARFARNAVITQILSDLGFVERLGYGVDRVVSSMRQAGLRPPRFEEIAGTFRVTLYNDIHQPETQQVDLPDLSIYAHLNLNQRQVQALEYVAHHRRINSREYQERCPEVHAESLRRDLADLVSKGVFIKIGDKRATYYILKKR